VVGSNPVAVLPKAYNSGLSIAGIADLNPAESMDFRLLCSLCVV
jgi:hypothetical protein